MDSSRLLRWRRRRRRRRSRRKRRRRSRTSTPSSPGTSEGGRKKGGRGKNYKPKAFSSRLRLAARAVHTWKFGPYVYGPCFCVSCSVTGCRQRSTRHLDSSGRLLADMFPYSVRCLVRQWIHVSGAAPLGEDFWKMLAYSTLLARQWIHSHASVHEASCVFFFFFYTFFCVKVDFQCLVLGRGAFLPCVCSHRRALRCLTVATYPFNGTPSSWRRRFQGVTSGSSCSVALGGFSSAGLLFRTRDQSSGTLLPLSVLQLSHAIPRLWSQWRVDGLCLRVQPRRHYICTDVSYLYTASVGSTRRQLHSVSPSWWRWLQGVPQLRAVRSRTWRSCSWLRHRQWHNFSSVFERPCTGAGPVTSAIRAGSGAADARELIL